MEAQDGGYIIGQGTYGCVFDQPLRCSSDNQRRNSKGYIGKVSAKSDAFYERAAAQYMSTIPGIRNYFVFADPKSFCKMGPVKRQTEEDLFECKVIREKGTGDMWRFTMPWGGVTMTSMLNRVKLDGAKFSPAAFVEHLLEAGAMAALNNFVHYDLHFGNITIDERTSRPRIIDFGFFFRVDEITARTFSDRRKEYGPSDEVEPPEITILTGISNGLPFSQTFLDVLRQKKPLLAAERRLGLSRQTQWRQFVAFWKNSEAAKRNDLKRFFELYWRAFDAWSIGGILLHFLSAVEAIPAATSVASWPSVRQRLRLVTRGLLRMSPQARLDAVEALALWNPESAILESPKAKEWLAKRDEVRAAVRDEGL